MNGSLKTPEKKQVKIARSTVIPQEIMMIKRAVAMLNREKTGMEVVGQMKSIANFWKPSNFSVKTGIKCISMSAPEPVHRPDHMRKNTSIS